MAPSAVSSGSERMRWKRLYEERMEEKYAEWGLPSGTGRCYSGVGAETGVSFLMPTTPRLLNFTIPNGSGIRCRSTPCLSGFYRCCFSIGLGSQESMS